MASLLRVIGRKYAMQILQALAEHPDGLRYVDIDKVRTPQTRTNTLDALVRAGLVDHHDRTYRLADKGRKALKLAIPLERLGQEV